MKWQLFKKKDPWIYGLCNERPARKHRKKGNVQFVLWKAGEQGHAEDYWHDFDQSWWVGFKSSEDYAYFNSTTKALILLVLPWHILSFSDFQGEPYGGFTAVSSIDIIFESTGNNEYEILDSITVWFHPEASFSISRDPYILNHEQGHLNICYLVCRRMNRLARSRHTKYTPDQFDAMMQEVTRRWHYQDDLYDKETDHSINKIAQHKWDLFIAKELAK